MREVVDNVFCEICMIQLGRAVTWRHRQVCKRQRMQQVQNIWLAGTGLLKSN